MSRFAPRRFLFDGRECTVAEIRALYPAYSASFLRRALEGGAATLKELSMAREKGFSRRCGTGKVNSAKSPWRRGIGGLRKGGAA